MGLDFLDDTVTDYENALIKTGYGKFHYMLLLICGLIYMETAISITILSFVLPSATCDFNMGSRDKGWLTASPMLGMLIGSYFWGCLADTKGRRAVLIGALFVDGICGLLSSIVPFYIAFLLLRFFNGFGVSGAMGICFPYLGEFQPTKYREKILCWMELFWTFGIILLPAIAWLIIPLEINITWGFFKLYSWSLFVAVCAVPSLLLASWLFYFPESPKFLIEQGETEHALIILKKIFTINTGNPAEQYEVTSLGPKKIKPTTETHRNSKGEVNPNWVPFDRKKLELFLREIWRQTKELARPPHRKNTILTCAIQFGITSSYYTLMVWFPELLTRFDEYSANYPDVDASLCDVTSSHQMINANTTSSATCDRTVENSVFLHTILIGLACIPTSLVLPLCVHRLGVKFFLVAGLTIAGAVTMGFYFIRNSSQNLALSCMFEALTSLSISAVYCVMVDLFPTNLRVMAAALSSTVGRAGALCGSLVFGFLIDIHCVIPIGLFAIMLFLSGCLCFLLPRTGSAALD